MTIPQLPSALVHEYVVPLWRKRLRAMGLIAAVSLSIGTIVQGLLERDIQSLVLGIFLLGDCAFLAWHLSTTIRRIIEVPGQGLRLSSRWRTVFIPYADVISVTSPRGSLGIAILRYRGAHRLRIVTRIPGWPEIKNQIEQRSRDYR